MSNQVQTAVNTKSKDGDTVVDCIRKNSLGSLISALILVCTMYLRSVHGQAMEKLDDLQKSFNETQTKVNAHDTQIKVIETSTAMNERATEKNFGEVKEQLRRIYDKLDNSKRIP